jgi:hypothetical protein
MKFEDEFIKVDDIVSILAMSNNTTNILVIKNISNSTKINDDDQFLHIYNLDKILSNIVKLLPDDWQNIAKKLEKHFIYNDFSHNFLVDRTFYDRLPDDVKATVEYDSVVSGTQVLEVLHKMKQEEVKLIK